MKNFTRSGEVKMKRLAFACVALAASTSLCSAAEFYVVQDTTTKQCRVVEQKPTDSKILIVGSGNQVFATKDEADAAMRSASMCNQAAQAAPVGAANMRAMSEVPAGTMTVANYYKQSVYDPSNNKIGAIEDILITQQGQMRALVIGVGGFLGIGEKDVIVPLEAVKGSNKDNKWTLVMNATKDELKAAQGFKYDRSKTTWVKEEASNTTGSR
jgi:sporulation protein YlmC with PRC-barrel domain